MPLSYLMAVAMIKVIPTVMVRLSNTNLYKRLVVFGLNLGMRKNAFLQEELGFISNMFWAEQLTAVGAYGNTKRRSVQVC